MRLLLLVNIFILFFFYSTYAACLNNCHNQGICNTTTNICQCYPNYYGDDCSIYIRNLPNGVTYPNQIVDTRAWNYFVTTINSSSSISYHLSTQSGDCDLYVLYNNIPTRSHYDQRDLSPDANINLNVTSTKPGSYFLGIYGYTRCSYTIYANVSSSGCPSNCGGHGTCSYLNTCVCYSNWTGPACSVFIPSIYLDTPVVQSANIPREWHYYNFTSLNSSYIDIQVSQSSASNCDVDLYVSFETLPSFTNWTYSQNFNGQNFSIGITSPPPGSWLIGIYTFTGSPSCLYTIVVTTNDSNGCPSSCSNHGSCHPSVGLCQCNAGFSGSFCETMDNALIDTNTISGFVDDGMWNYYHYVSRSTNNVQIWVNQTGHENKSEDCDVYVKGGSLPSQTNYDYVSVALSVNNSIVVSNAGMQTWYIGVYGFQSCAYVLSAYVESNCVEGCVQPYGACAATGGCVCNDGYAGDNCHNVVHKVDGSGSTINETVTTNQWVYYEVQLSSSYLTVSMLEVNTVGEVWLFVNQQYFPTLSESDYADKETNTNLHSVTVQSGGTIPATYYVGVYGSPFALASAGYQISIWTSQF
eukprot:TRINITY_DN7544_c0_g1_i1.p1 TRINITY_DN7544_c0_g1~~TRINITY_DN7544_c0_g1_i1.p1  ORF type:complete len:582 (-),score=24.50 TRINITY_DN7544_c0_g1_i1:32-1777(-)